MGNYPYHARDAGRGPLMPFLVFQSRAAAQPSARCGSRDVTLHAFERLHELLAFQRERERTEPKTPERWHSTPSRQVANPDAAYL